MAGRDRVAVVCRDCGEVGRYELAGLKPGGLASCPACGLLTDLSHARAPPDLPGGGRGARGPGAPRRAGARVGR